MQLFRPGCLPNCLPNCVPNCVSLVLCLGLPLQAWSAGCVTSRGVEMPHSMFDAHASPVEGLLTLESARPEPQWQVSMAYRQFTSDRTYIGDDEQGNAGDGMVNHSRFLDFSLGYAINSQNRVALVVPLAYHARSQPTSATDSTRYETTSGGIGDIRLYFRHSLWNPQSSTDGNLQLGAGIELPTGANDQKDDFRRFNFLSGQTDRVKQAVDPSIQPGDGGWALLLETSGWIRLAGSLGAYGEVAYAITSQEKNNVPATGGNSSPASIADNYLWRTGLDYRFNHSLKPLVSMGLRTEGVPVHDLIGGSDGFRRPGYDIAIEPGAALSIDQWTLALTLPYTIQRQRKQSDEEQQLNIQGEASFADYQLLFSASTVF